MKGMWCRVVTRLDERFLGLVLVQVKVLDFVKVDFTELFIMTAMIIGKKKAKYS
jgi:hypothetical protein